MECISKKKGLNPPLRFIGFIGVLPLCSGLLSPSVFPLRDFCCFLPVDFDFSFRPSRSPLSRIPDCASEAFVVHRLPCYYREAHLCLRWLSLFVEAWEGTCGLKHFTYQCPLVLGCRIPEFSRSL